VTSNKGSDWVWDRIETNHICIFRGWSGGDFNLRLRTSVVRKVGLLWDVENLRGQFIYKSIRLPLLSFISPSNMHTMGFISSIYSLVGSVENWEFLLNWLGVG